MYRKILLFLTALGIVTLACSASGLIQPTKTPRPTNEPFTVVPPFEIGASPTPQVAFATFDPNAYSGHDATPPAPTVPTASSPFCPPGWYQTSSGCALASYEYFAYTADTCVGMDDSGKLLLIVRTSIGAGIDFPDGLRYLSCWMDHPSDFDGYQWYTSPELPTGIKEVLLYEGEGIASINYCIGNCSISEEPIWQGWTESSQSDQSVWNLDQKITAMEAFYPDGFVGESTYDFYTR